MIVALLASPFKPQRWLDWCQLNFDSLSPTWATHFWQIAVRFEDRGVAALSQQNVICLRTLLWQQHSAVLVMSPDILWSHASCSKRPGQCVNSLNALSVERRVHGYKPQHLWLGSWLGHKVNSRRNITKLRIMKVVDNSQRQRHC